VQVHVVVMVETLLDVMMTNLNVVMVHVFTTRGNAMVTMIVVTGQMRLIVPQVVILNSALKDIVLKEHTLMVIAAMIVITA